MRGDEFLHIFFTGERNVVLMFFLYQDLNCIAPKFRQICHSRGYVENLKFACYSPDWESCWFPLELQVGNPSWIVAKNLPMRKVVVIAGVLRSHRIHWNGEILSVGDSRRVHVVSLRQEIHFCEWYDFPHTNTNREERKMNTEWFICARFARGVICGTRVVIF